MPSLDAQERIPNRPRLEAAADSNDWEAYYDQGVAWLNSEEYWRAEAAFYWSSRLNPGRAEPWFARWTVAWARDAKRFARFLLHDSEEPLPPELLRIDSLRYRALMRNPLVYQGLVMAAYQELPGRWGEDLWTIAWLAYGTLEFNRALANFNRALNRDPQRFGEARYLRATIYVAAGRLDSATAELGALLDTLRRHDKETVTQVYESKALVLYALGLLQASRRQFAAARTAIEDALVEDLSFYPAHITLGQLAAARGQTAEALQELAHGAAGGANDPIARYEFGAALVRAGRAAEGVTELQAAVTLEPYYADSYYWLGEALLTQNDSAGALRAFQSYSARASVRAPELGRARQRLTALAAPREE